MKNEIDRKILDLWNAKHLFPRPQRRGKWIERRKSVSFIYFSFNGAACQSFRAQWAGEERRVHAISCGIIQWYRHRPPGKVDLVYRGGHISIKSNVEGCSGVNSSNVLTRITTTLFAMIMVIHIVVGRDSTLLLSPNVSLYKVLLLTSAFKSQGTQSWQPLPDCADCSYVYPRACNVHTYASC